MMMKWVHKYIADLMMSCLLWQYLMMIFHDNVEDDGVLMHAPLWWWSRPWRHVQFARPFDDDDSVWIMSDWCLSSTNSIHWHWLRYVHDTYTLNIQRYIEIYSICIYVDTVVDTYNKVSTVYNECRGVWMEIFTMVK